MTTLFRTTRAARARAREPPQCADPAPCKGKPGESAIPDLARDRPDAYLARDRRSALHAGRSLPDRVEGAALFADISGFTPLTEALAGELGPQRGAEELVASIGRVFHAVIEALDAFDGNVISFAGDAITCWLDGDDGSRACAAAIRMQEAIARTGTITTPGGTTVHLAMKVAIAVGNARRFVVGDPDIQLIDVLAGRLLDLLAAAEHHAEKGEIVLDQSAVASLGPRVVLGTSREDPDTERTLRVLRGLAVDVEPAPGHQPGPLPDDLVRQWLLPAVYERLQTGRGEFLAELRPAIPLFLRFSGIDYDRGDDAIGKLDGFTRAAQRIFEGYGGNVLQLTLGDKGAYLYGVFGSPLAHEDDAARAAAAALELRDLGRTTAARDISIGITQGRLRSGTYGHEMRRTFVCMGDSVNLAARLMAAAPAGSVFAADSVRQAAGESFLWTRLAPMRVKGKSQAIEAWSLTGSLERASRRKTRFELDLVGRHRELAHLRRAHEAALGGHGRVVGIAAEAGMGKSRLVAEFVRDVRRAGHTVAFGECQAYGTRTPYFVWREIWRRLFGLEDEGPAERQVAQLEGRLAAVDPGLVVRAPLLADVVGISIPDNDVTRGLDAKLRKASLEDLLSTILTTRAREAPFVAVLEDCHWIDELSADLLRVLVRTASTLPVCFVLAYRPAAEPGGGLDITGERGFGELALDRMEPADVMTLARAKAEQLAGADVTVSDALLALVAERAEGNPFYAEELLSFVAAQGVDLADPAAATSVRLPESLHSLVMSRIDAALEGPRRTLKVASVVGRVFEASTLPGAYAELGTIAEVVTDLGALRTLDLVGLDREAEQAWMFKHAVTQEVAYESLPFTLRAELHGRVGTYLERTAPDVDRILPLLEHHYWRSDIGPKKLEYLRKAGAAAQASYANNAAIAYYERLLTLLDGPERVDQAIRLAEVLQLVGDIPRAVQAATDARAAAEAIGDPRAIARCDHSLAESARRSARFDDATALLAAARAGFTAVGDEAGVGDVLQVTGNVLAQRGEVDAAQAAYREGLALRERLGDTAGLAALTNNLGIVAVRRGDLAEARSLGERALALYRELDDRRRICSCEINLGWMEGAAGDHASALRHLEQAARLASEVGDRLNLALAENNKGDALRDLGRLDEAGAAYRAAVEAYRDLGDTGPLMALFEDVAALAALCGRAGEALMLVGASDTLRSALGSPRPDGAEADLMARLAAAPGALHDPQASAARDAGAALPLDAAVALARAACQAAGGTELATGD